MEAIRLGIPLSLRAMCLEFPDDPTSWHLDRQFMLGDSLLVAPIFEESGDVEFYLPRGKWTNFFTNEVKAGPGWFKERHEFHTLPLYVKENTILVLGKKNELRTVYDYTEDVEVCLYQAVDGAKTTLVDSEGRHMGDLIIRNGELEGRDILKGSHHVTKDGRDWSNSHVLTGGHKI
jgi:alpha-D-xyloside xylohydrolase